MNLNHLENNKTNKTNKQHVHAKDNKYIITPILKKTTTIAKNPMHKQQKKTHTTHLIYKKNKENKQTRAHLSI